MGEVIIIIIILVVGLIIILGKLLSKKAIIKRKLMKAPYRSLSQFKTGQVGKIVGSVEFGEKPLTAPLSGRTCAYYHVKVEKRVSSGKSSHWETLIEEEDQIAYLIRDGKHFAIIADDHIRSYIVQDANYSSGLFDDATPNLEHFLGRHGYESEGLFGFNKTMRYREGVLENQEEVAVLGQGDWQEAKDFGLPAELGKVLAMQGVDQGYVYLSDDPDTLNTNVRETQNNKNEQKKSFDRSKAKKRKHRYNRDESGYLR